MSIEVNKIFKKLIGYAFQAAVMSCFFIALELIFYFMQGYEDATLSRLIYPVVFSVPLGFFLTAIFSLFPRKVM